MLLKTKSILFRFKIQIIIFVIPLVTTSCFHKSFIQKSYTPNPPVINHFEGKGDGKANVYGNFSVVESQGK